MSNLNTQIVISARDRASSTLKKVAGATDMLYSSMFSLQGALAAVGGTMAISEMTSMMDQFTLMEDRIRLVTDSAAELAEAMDRTYEIAGRTRSGWNGTVGSVCPAWPGPPEIWDIPRKNWPT